MRGAAGEGSSGTFRGADGLLLHARAWEAAEARAALLVSHGLGEHSGRYATLAADLVARGVSVFATDHRGHGRSPGTRGHVRRFAELVDDLEAFRAHVAARLPAGLPVFLLGHSLGGLVAIRHLEEYAEAPFAGAVLSAPLLGVALRPPAWKVSLAGALARIAPSLRLANGIDPADLCSDEAVVAAYRADPLVHPWVTPRLYVEIQAAMRAAVERRGRIRVPLLFVVPGADRIVLSDATETFASDLRGDVEVRRFAGLRHEALNELERGEVVVGVADWIAKRIPG
ncbi:MAG TPA: alpha/beta hydrolase [Longimicrobiaceae bacterium]|nr:alpha/beta hydrolase [Longimicrobiaceae bacterium]